MRTTAIPTGLEDRAPAPEQARAVLDLIVACDIADIGAPDYTLADLEADWTHPRFELDRDARVLVDSDGAVRAYVAVRQSDPGRSFWGDLFVHPELRGGPAEPWGMAFAEERATALAEDPDAVVFLYAPEGSALAGLFEELGYADVRHLWRMAIDLPSRPPSQPPPVPDGITIRNFDPDDARALHAAVEESFATHWDHREEPFEEWSARKLDHGDFDPADWWVAWDGDEIAGMVLAEVGAGVDIAWISTVGVRPAWRGRGVAIALLRTAFHELAHRGVPGAALGVDSQNATGATQLYERAGMHVALCWVRYQRPVTPR